jgi:hypothetical protein
MKKQIKKFILVTECASIGDECYLWNIKYRSNARWMKQDAFVTELDMVIYRAFEKKKRRCTHKAKIDIVVPVFHATTESLPLSLSPPSAPLVLFLPLPPFCSTSRFSPKKKKGSMKLSATGSIVEK